jgi:Ca2+-binding EF-hand superfamily protein
MANPEKAETEQRRSKMKKMVRKISLSLAFALMLSGVALASTEILSASFEALDVNEDGYLSKEEAQEAKILTDAFELADVNKDNMLDQAEYASVASE